jgi:hypothetical protein
MNIFACDWIANGWMIALREHGGLSEASVKPAGMDSAAYIADVTSALKSWRDDPQFSSIMLSRDDYSLVSEFEPDIRKHTPPELDQLERPPDKVGRSSITLEGALWLKCGWIFALRKHGGYHIAHVTADAADAAEYTLSLLTGIKALANKEDTATIFLSPDDYRVAADNLTKAE